MYAKKHARPSPVTMNWEGRVTLGKLIGSPPLNGYTDAGAAQREFMLFPLSSEPVKRVTFSPGMNTKVAGEKLGSVDMAQD